MRGMILMKTLTKIKLINWHGFYDETINIQGATLITGDNGCGKSTLLDAIYFLLAGKIINLMQRQMKMQIVI